MRFIVDSFVSVRACDALRHGGHHVEWVPDVYEGDPGDEAIIDRALASDRILVTGDKDFGEWIFLRGKSQPPLIRLAAMSPANVRTPRLVKSTCYFHNTYLERLLFSIQISRSPAARSSDLMRWP